MSTRWRTVAVVGVLCIVLFPSLIDRCAMHFSPLETKDMAELWTSGWLEATRHRVDSPVSGQEPRRSFVLFQVHSLLERWVARAGNGDRRRKITHCCLSP